MKCCVIILALLAIVAMALADEDNSCPLRKCTRIYSPVCASDADGTTQTFNNQCEFENYACHHPTQNLKIVSQGGCPKA